MNKKMYETPRTQHVEVELEEGVMNGASVFRDPEDSGTLKINDQEVGAEYDFSQEEEWK